MRGRSIERAAEDFARLRSMRSGVARGQNDTYPISPCNEVGWVFRLGARLRGFRPGRAGVGASARPRAALAEAARCRRRRARRPPFSAVPARPNFGAFFAALGKLELEHSGPFPSSPFGTLLEGPPLSRSNRTSGRPPFGGQPSGASEACRDVHVSAHILQFLGIHAQEPTSSCVGSRHRDC